jgi:aminopeptidase N
VQAAALEALGLLADPSSISSIETMMAVELDGRLRRRGREVVRNLAEASSQSDELKRLRDEVDSLRSLTTTLRDRLDALEADHKHKHRR